MFGSVEDDDLEFNPAAGSKLASLFNLERSPEKGNSSLTYTAPKQPKTHLNDDCVSSKRSAPSVNTSTSATTNKLSLIAVKAVTSFKLEDGNYNIQGKLGLALLGNSTSRLFQLLLYKGKQQQITSVRITPHFQFTVQPHLYASFYDDRNQNWSIMFENKDDAVEFTTHVAVARYRSVSPGEEHILSQELLLGNGDSFKEGETVLLKLAAQPFSVDDVQPVDIKKYIIECTLSHKLVGSGWAAGILGAAPGSVRVIIVPLNTQVPWLSSKRSEPLLIEANITSVESSEVDIPQESLLSEQSKNKSNAATSRAVIAVDSGNEDSTVRATGASIKEALTNSPRSNKASIISRMARMGQATLPLKGAITCNPSDSEETEEDSGTLGNTKPPLKARPGKTRTVSSTLRQQTVTSSPQNMSVSSSAAPATVSVIHPPTHWNQHQQNVMRTDGSVVQLVSSEGQMVSLSSQQQLPFMTAASTVMSPSDPTPHISMLLSEARMQNTEMRMHLSKFNDKMDQLMTKVDNLQLSKVSPVTSNTTEIGLEPNILLSSIEKLVRDNQSLKAELAEKTKRLEEQNERVFSLLNTNSKFLEQSSSFLEQKQLQEQKQLKQDELQKQQAEQFLIIQQIQEEKTSLGNQLESLQNQLGTVQDLVQALQKSNSELNQELQATRNRLQEKEKCLLELITNKQTLGTEDQLLQLTQALDSQKLENLRLQEQIASERTRFDSEKKIADEAFRLLAQQQKFELTEVNDQISKQADNYLKTIRSLENKYEELSKKLQGPSEQVTAINPASFDQLITDVKVLMNTLHKGLNQQFAPDQIYEGVKIRTIISSIVKREALQFVGRLEREQCSAKDPSDRLDVRGVNSNPVVSCMKPIDSAVGELKGSEKSVETTAVTSPSTLQQVEDVESNIKSLNVSESRSTVTPADVPASSETVSEVTKEDCSLERSWRPLPPPPPLFHDDEDSDDWLT